MGDDGLCHTCKGAKHLALGLIILANWYLMFADWWLLLGVLLIIMGIVKMVKPTCPHCTMPAKATVAKASVPSKPARKR